MKESVSLGFIGLGLMGKPMAKHLLAAGHSLTVHNRSQGVINELAALGAHPVNSPRDVASLSDILFTCLPDSPDIEAIAFGKEGVVDGAHEGLTVVDHSTIKPASARKIAERLRKVGIQFLDAPVSGGQVGAENGSLTIMVGGDSEALEKVRGIMQAYGKAITYIGTSGAGQVAKCCNQIMVAAQMAAMSELLIFARKADVDPRKVVEAIKGGAAQCWTLDNKPERLFAGNRKPGFKAHMQIKDLNIVMDSASEIGMPLPTTEVNTRLYKEMIDMNLGDSDNSALVEVFEKMAGVNLV